MPAFPERTLGTSVCMPADQLQPLLPRISVSFLAGHPQVTFILLKLRVKLRMMWDKKSHRQTQM